ncbi:MmgE/PrpD family protein [Rhodococcus sp. WS4]|nr:MmgE/PrpD family protein [Rhodococcus sp. WS4]
MSSPAPSPTQALIGRLTSFDFATLPPDVVTAARHCIRDWLAVGIAGSTQDVTRLVRDEVFDRGGNPQATLLGAPKKVSAHDAALCNGTASHALDFDDVLETMLGHPSAPVLSAAMAVGEKIGATGAAVMTALVAGIETESFLGRLMEPGHHEAGWHTTATLGTFGATAAVAHLLRLNGDQINHAFGLAGAQAAGMKVSFGTMAKPFHAGRAAANGVLAASLAQRGVTAAADTIEAPGGYAELTTDTLDRTAVSTLREDDYDIKRVLFKRHASCYLTHSLIEGLLQLRPLLGSDTRVVSAVHLHVLPVHLTTCNSETARTGLEGKFSMRFLAGLALVAGKASEQEFSDAWLNHPEIRRISELVQVVPDHIGAQMATPVEVQTIDGRMLRACVDMGIPASGRSVLDQQTRLVEKFDSLVEPVNGRGASTRLSELVQSFEHLEDVRTLMSYTRGRAGESVV